MKRTRKFSKALTVNKFQMVQKVAHTRTPTEESALLEHAIAKSENVKQQQCRNTQIFL